MTSKNGFKELVSVLQYIKDTRIDNPEIIVKDPRILELDDIVQEVKASDEWESVKMDILELGLERGKELGLQQGRQEGIQEGRQEGEIFKLKAQVGKKLAKGYSVSEIADALEDTEENIAKIIEDIKKQSQ